jgi:histidyl-tRNA synthetase
MKYLKKKRQNEFVKGSEEWFGTKAEIFLSVRQNLEKLLLSKGFRYFYGGFVSKREIYEKRKDQLGETFLKNLVSFNKAPKSLILAPEYTMRVYDFLNRYPELKEKEGKIFYSQEFIRNENPKDVIDGKTFDFWQIGYEIYSNEDKDIDKSALCTLENCFNILKIPNVYFKLSDKRILEGILLDYSLNERRQIYYTIDLCNENPDKIYDALQNQGLAKNKLKQIRELLSLNISLCGEKEFEEIVCNKHSMEGFYYLKKLFYNISNNMKKKTKLVSFIPKSWDACDTLLFEGRVIGYPYAIAGGGSLLSIKENGKLWLRSGAGIGVTRISEYINSNKK